MSRMSQGGQCCHRLLALWLLRVCKHPGYYPSQQTEITKYRVTGLSNQRYYRPFLNPALATRLLWLALHIPRVLTDGQVGTTTGPWRAVSSKVIEPICTQCSCPDDGTGWKGSQSLESCAQTCEQEGSWFKHASGRRYDGETGPWVYFSAYDHVPKIVDRSFVPVVDN